jgi:hypothetical protein
MYQPPIAVIPLPGEDPTACPTTVNGCRRPCTLTRSTTKPFPGSWYFARSTVSGKRSVEAVLLRGGCRLLCCLILDGGIGLSLWLT